VTAPAGQTRLTLEAADCGGPEQWRWVLRDDTGAVIGDHEVRLDPTDPQLEAFRRLPRYLRRSVSPDDPIGSEATLVADLGDWIGAQVLGPIGPLLVDHAPAVVELRLDPAARELQYRPLELGHVDGEPLAVSDVTLVHLPATSRRSVVKQVDGTVRALAVFSLPHDASLLAVRSQRRELVRLFTRLRAQDRADVRLRVLQWRVTEAALTDALNTGPGWDVLHFSGHGLVDALVVQDDAGRQVLIGADRVGRLLRRSRHRLKLIVLSSCLSAGAPDPGTVPLAEHLAAEVGCAVVGMRYAVGDDFATVLTRQLYESMLHQQQPLPGAMQLAARAAAAVTGPGAPPRSVAVPAVFGEPAITLTLQPGAAPRSLATDQPMAHFPPEPRVFEGRAGQMTRASAALTDEDAAGVYLTGPPGIGTTSCALESAYSHAAGFPTLLWHQVDLPGNRIGGSLDRFADDLDRQAPELGLRPTLGSIDALTTQLARIRFLLREEAAVLVVVDNIDPLLTDTGRWRDDRWGQAIDALSPGGLSRIVLTGTRTPAHLPANITVVPVPPLAPLEAVVVARSLPALRPLLQSGDERLVRILTGAAGVPGQLAAADAALAAGHAPSAAAPSAVAAEYRRLLRQFTVTPHRTG